MGKAYRIAIEIFILETVVLTIAIAYVFGLMNGIQSQQQIIKEILEDLPYRIIVDSESYTHPLWKPLLGIALITAAFWIAVLLYTYQRRKHSM